MDSTVLHNIGKFLAVGLCKWGWPMRIPASVGEGAHASSLNYYFLS
jgi:hypothetical protein